MAYLLALLVCATALQEGEKPKSVKIKTKSAAIKDGPGVEGKTIRVVKMGEEFKTLAFEGAWIKLDLGESATGYIHKSATIDAKKFVPPPPGEEGTPPSTNMAMGAKGWTPEIEKDYSQKNNLQAEFKILDEQVVKSPAYKLDRIALEQRLERFRKEGRLK